jgi:hypothetical protein
MAFFIYFLLGQDGHLSHEVCGCVCVRVLRFRGAVFRLRDMNRQILPPMTSLPYLGLVVLPLRTPWGIWREGFPTSSLVSWLELRGHCLEAAPQPRNLSRKVFITALVERAVLTIRARVCRAFGSIAVQRTLQECGGGAGIKYLSRMEKKKAPLNARESAYTNSL